MTPTDAQLLAQANASAAQMAYIIISGSIFLAALFTYLRHVARTGTWRFVRTTTRLFNDQLAADKADQKRRAFLAARRTARRIES
jgi:hypothetical protein